MLKCICYIAATERTFSAFSRIHSKKRSCLTSEKAATLTYLSYNWKLLNGDEEIQRKKEKLDIIDEGNKEQENVL